MFGESLLEEVYGLPEVSAADDEVVGVEEGVVGDTDVLCVVVDSVEAAEVERQVAAGSLEVIWVWVEVNE